MYIYILYIYYILYIFKKISKFLEKVQMSLLFSESLLLLLLAASVSIMVVQSPTVAWV